MTSDTNRIEAFSDGVFSIAATLLVLELKPPAPGTTFWHGISQQWPGYASFFLSFLFIGIMWINHHRLFSHVKHSDDALMAANLMLLLGVVWIPYPTLPLAQAVATGQLRDAAIFYNASYVALALLFNLLLFTCIKRGLVDRSYAGVRGIAWRFASGPALYVMSLIVTFWSVPLSLAINAGLAMFYLVSPDQSAKAHAARHQ
jgi:uncharacterized membrane protein